MMKLMQLAFEEAEEAGDGGDKEFTLELPDPEYTLDDLMALSEKRELAERQEDRRNDSTQHLLVTACELSKALEHLNYYGESALPTVCANVYVSSALKRYQPQLSLEAFNLKATTSAVLSTIKDLFKRIWEAIKKAIAWVGEQIRDRASLDRLTLESVERATETFLMIRHKEQSRLNRVHALKLVNENEYVDLAGYKLWLVVDGCQPEPGKEDYAYAMARVLKVVQTQKMFESSKMLKVVETLQEMVGDIAESRPMKDISKVFDPTSIVPEGSSQVGAFHDYVPEKDRILFAYDELLGSVAFCNEYPRHPEPSPEYTALNQLAGWLTVFRKVDATMSSGALRVLHTDEVEKTSKLVVQIGQAIDKQRTSLQTFQRMTETIGTLVADLEKKVNGMEDPNPVMVYEYCKVAQACNTLVRNGATVLDSTTMYARKVMYAWGLYVTATTKKDMDLVRQVSSIK